MLQQTNDVELIIEALLSLTKTLTSPRLRTTVTKSEAAAPVVFPVVRKHQFEAVIEGFAAMEVILTEQALSALGIDRRSRVVCPAFLVGRILLVDSVEGSRHV